MWFESWSEIFRVVAVGAAAYVTLVIVLRVSGKRSLAKLNAFDLVVTVALGSTLATIILDANVSWLEGAIAFATLTVLQFVITWVTTRAPRARAAVSASPTLLLRDGAPLQKAMRRQRVTIGELRQAARGAGNGDLAGVGAIILESDGSLSVVAAQNMGDATALEDVEMNNAE